MSVEARIEEVRSRTNVLNSLVRSRSPLHYFISHGSDVEPEKKFQSDIQPYRDEAGVATFDLLTGSKKLSIKSRSN